MSAFGEYVKIAKNMNVHALTTIGWDLFWRFTFIFDLDGKKMNLIFFVGDGEVTGVASI